MNTFSFERSPRAISYSVLVFFVLLIFLSFGEFLKQQKERALAEESNQELSDEALSTDSNNSGSPNLSRIRLKDAMAELRIKDKRTFKKWCVLNGVEIIPDVGGMYVFKEEFEYKAKIKAVEMMKKKYGSKWNEVIASGTTKQEKDVADKPTKIDNPNSTEYQPQGEKEKMFYEKLMNSKDNIIG